MRKFLPILTISIALFSWGCGGDQEIPEEPKPPVTIPAEFSNITFDGEEEQKVVNFTATEPWSIELAETKAVSWMRVSPMSGEAGSVTLSIEADINTTFEARSASIAIKVGGSTFTLSLTQSGKERTLRVDKNSMTFDEQGGKEALNVTSNSDWATSGTPEWVTLTPSTSQGDMAVEVICDENSAINERDATITFTAGSLTHQLSINQKGVPVTLTIDKTAISVGHTQSTTSLNLSSNTQWTTSGVPEWVALTPASGDGDATVQVVIEENTTTSAREATITFTTGTIVQTLNIHQSIAQFEDLDPEEL